LCDGSEAVLILPLKARPTEFRLVEDGKALPHHGHEVFEFHDGAEGEAEGFEEAAVGPTDRFDGVWVLTTCALVVLAPYGAMRVLLEPSAFAADVIVRLDEFDFDFRVGPDLVNEVVETRAVETGGVPAHTEVADEPSRMVWPQPDSHLRDSRSITPSMSVRD